MLVSISASHKNTSFETLERLSAKAAGLSTTLADAHDTIRGVVVVATCNRFETYLDVTDDGHSPGPAVWATLEHLASRSGLGTRAIRESVQFAHGHAVAEHLFSVAAGLESVVPGEDEIAGQVRRSIESSRTAGTSTSELEHLFQRATQASREVRAGAKVAQAGRSIIQLALELASTRVADWNSARVLIIGSGRYAAASVAALRERGTQNIQMHSLSGRGQHFAVTHSVPLVGAEHFALEVGLADVIIACTNAEGFALDASTFSRGATKAVTLDPAWHQSYRLLIDLGMPRNIDPQVSRLENLELLDLETIRLHASIDEYEQIDHARAILRAASQRFAMQSRGQDVSPSIVSMRNYVQDLVEAEVRRLAAAGKLGPEAEKAVRHLGGILMHRLTIRGQQLAGIGEAGRWVDGLESVFGITEAPGALPGELLERLPE